MKVACVPAWRMTVVLLGSAALLAGCQGKKRMEQHTTPIACRLDALTPADRAREGALLREHLASVLEAREGDEGFSFRYPGDPALFVRMAELVSLEHRCCPFLDFRLEWRAEREPWLHVTGGAPAKTFLRDTFRGAR